jgi:hypothetical protein
VSLNAYMTPAGRWTRLAFQKIPLGREKRTRSDYFTGRAPRTHQKAPQVFWFGVSLSVMGSITQAVAWLLMLTGGTG